MESVLFKFDNVSIYAFSLVVVLSYLWGSFVFYKRAVDAHVDDLVVLDVIVLSGFWSLIIGRLWYVAANWQIFWNNWPRVLFLKNYPGISSWGLLCGVLIGLWLIVSRLKIKYIDTLDFLVIGLVAGLSVFFGGISLSVLGVTPAVLSIASLAMLVVLWKMETEYRTYEWYRNKKTQAKSGLISGIGIAFFGVIVMVANLLSKTVTPMDMTMSVIVCLGGVVLLYSRSGRVFGDDIKSITRYGRKK